MPALAPMPIREDRGAPGAALLPRAPGPPTRAGLAPGGRRDWTSLPQAAAILADCAARPPATRMVKVTDLTTYHARRYVGARVRTLCAIHRAEADRLFAAGEAARDYGAFDAHIRLSVQHAIADALFHASLVRSAACDRRALSGAR